MSQNQLLKRSEVPVQDTWDTSQIFKTEDDFMQHLKKSSQKFLN